MKRKMIIHNTLAALLLTVFFFTGQSLSAQLLLMNESGFLEEWAEDDNLPPQPQARSQPAVQAADNEPESERRNRPRAFERRTDEFGINAWAGFDRNLFGIGIRDIFQTVIGFDLNEIRDKISETGLNVHLTADVYYKSMNNKSGDSLWDMELFGGVNGRLNLNTPQSSELLTDGTGDITAQGAVYADIGLNVSAAFGKLRVGVTPAVFFPLLFVPKSGINYEIETGSGINLDADGAITAYGPFFGDNGILENISYGVDLSLNCEYRLFSFLDLGAGISGITIIPAVMNNGIRLVLDEDNFSDFEFKPEGDIDEIKVRRPVKFDFFARYIPFDSELLTIIPNVGFTYDINNELWYFNTGVGVHLNFGSIFLVSLATNYEEEVWKHSLGLAVNIRFIEINLEAALLSESFTEAFQGQRLGVNLGLRLGR